MTDPERLDDYRYYYDWHASKPVLRLRWQAWLIVAAFWLVVALVYWAMFQ